MGGYKNMTQNHSNLNSVGQNEHSFGYNDHQIRGTYYQNYITPKNLSLKQQSTATNPIVYNKAAINELIEQNHYCIQNGLSHLSTNMNGSYNIAVTVKTAMESRVVSSFKLNFSFPLLSIFVSFNAQSVSFKCNKHFWRISYCIPVAAVTLKYNRQLVDSQMSLQGLRDNLAEKIRIESYLVREFFAEFIGTFFLLLIGVSANIQSAASATGNIISAQFAWGFGLAFGIYLAVNVSGGHLNPALSLSAMFCGHLSFVRFIFYIFAQIAGAFFGSAVAYFGHLSDIHKIDVRGQNATIGLFATYPAQHMTHFGCFIDQVIGTAILAGIIGLITDKKHRIPSGIAPLLVGITLTMIAMTFGANAGFAINPARDFGPRLFILCVGYGWTVFSANNYYFWIPIVAPLIGAVVGVFVYKIFVGLHGNNEKVEITNRPSYSHDDRGYKVGPKA